jgi:hypothetical protein
MNITLLLVGDVYSSSQMHHSSFDVPVRDLPEPAVDWKAFFTRIGELNDRTPLVFNPITKKVTKWIDMTALDKKYGKNSKANKAADKKKQKGKQLYWISCCCQYCNR